jgi:hypothetical protein
MSHGGSKTRGAWRAHVGCGEEVILTRHQKGNIAAEDIHAAMRYYIETAADGTLHFKDRATGDIFDSPSGLCRGRLPPRQGKKGTNDWNGPMHCLVLRGGNWIPLAKLGGSGSDASSDADSVATATTSPSTAVSVKKKRPAVAAPKTLEEENAELRPELAAVKAQLAALRVGIAKLL